MILTECNRTGSWYINMDAYCFVPVLCAAILVIISNLSMVIHIFKANYQSKFAGFLFKFIGISNVASSVCMCAQAVLKQPRAPLPLKFIITTATMVSLLLQLGFNVSLAFERHQVIANAAKYHSINAKKHLGKKLSLVVFAVSMGLGIFFTTLKFHFKSILFLFIPVGVSRIIGYIILCVLYTKLYFAIKSSNKVLTNSSAEQGEPSTCSNAVIKRRKRQLEHSKKFFIGITSTFLVLNLPVTVAFFSIKDESLSCISKGGIISLISIALSQFNMAFDTFWYFYMIWHSTRPSRI